MECYELIIQERPQRHYRNGRFLKGHTPFNKGKKWSDYLSDEQQQKFISNFTKNANHGRKDIGGWNKKEVVAIKNGKFCGVFESCTDAADKLNVCIRNVSYVANGKRKRCGGYEFYFEKDFEIWSKKLTS